MLHDGISPQAAAVLEPGSLTNREQIAVYLDMLFGYVDFEDGDEIRLRGLGRKAPAAKASFARSSRLIR